MEFGSQLNHYRISAKLGEGGMGEVYRAEDGRLKRDVAIKVLPSGLARDPERLARLEREAQLLAQLEHPNIAAVYGLEESGEVRFLVMQLAEGRTLAERIAEGALQLEEALQIGLQVASGLEAAHQKGIVHRDLKPGNIQIGSDGKVSILDFGLAKALSQNTNISSTEVSDSPTVVEATQAGMILGTAGYMSPEQARGRLLDHRTDVWAFGCVLFEMLTGDKAFPGDTVTDVLGGVVRGEPNWESLPERTPRRIRALLRRCLRKDINRRIQAIGDARVSIEEYLEDPIAAEAILDGSADPSPKWNRVLPWAVAGILAILLAVFFWIPRPEVEDRQLHLKVELSERRIDAGIGPGFSFSPDGTRLAYAVLSPDGDTETVFLRPMNRAESLELASGGSNNGPYNPFFSPDGEWVGFVTPTELKKVSVTGGTPIHLADAGRSRGASWGPGGAIAFAPRPNSGLSLVSDQGGEIKELTTLDPEKKEATHRWPHFMPNGKAVLFTSNSSTAGTFDQANIEAVILATGERRVLHRGGTHPIYSPTGHLLFANEGTIFAAPFDEDSLEVTGNALPMLHDVSMNEEGSVQFAISNVGVVAYLTGRAAIPEYPVLRVDRNGEPTVLWSEKGAYGNPRLSPDGKRMSLSVVREGNVDVWVYDLERNVATRLTFDVGYDGDAVWSPDGEELIYSSARTGRFDLYRKSADGSSPEQQVTDSNREKYPLSWAPDGRSVITYQLAHSNDLVVVDLEDPKNSQPFVGDPNFAEQDAAFSPDGSWVAYTSNESGRWEVYVRPYPPGGGKWQVSDGGGGWPRWSRDGRELFYRTENGLMVARVEATEGRFRAGRPEPLFEGEFRGGPQGVNLGSYRFADYDVFPDGQSFVMFPADEEGSGPGGHIHLLTGWFDDVQRSFLSSTGSSNRQ